MTVDEALRNEARRLSATSSTPRLDAEVLLAHVLGVTRASLLARAFDALSGEARAAFEAMALRRAAGEPVAYITGHREFYGLDVVVNRDVLVPRPETESVVDACLELLPADMPASFADIGTGSGAIAVAVASRRPLVRVFAVELSPQALSVARSNVERHGLSEQVVLLEGDLLSPLPGRVNVIAANLPYVSPGEASPEVAIWEPHVAVFGGGADGMDLIARFLSDAPNYLAAGGAIVIETAYSQGALVSRAAKNAFPGADVEVRKDLAGYDRIVVIRT
jgi:release factor glutamine methyltransferase